MWPLAMAHLRNSKYAPSTVAWQTAPVAAFLADPDAILESTQARTVYPGARRIPLPAPAAAFGPSLWKVLRRRRTTRALSRRPVPRRTLGRLLGAAAGTTGSIPIPGTAGLVQRLRAWPSAGALYPVEVYAVLPDEGSYHYDPVDSCLEVLVEGPLRDRIAPAILTASGEGEAPLLLVLSGVPERTLRKYGERGYRFLWLDAGHLAQNLLLAAEALGLGACPIGGFCDDALARAAGIDPRESVLYVLAVGHRAEG